MLSLPVWTTCEPLVNYIWLIWHWSILIHTDHIDPVYHFTYLYIILYNFTIFYITSCDLRWSLCATKYWCCVQPMLRPFYRKDLAQSCPILYLGLLILAGLAGIFPTWPGATSVGRKADAWNLTRFFEKKTHFIPFLVARALPSELIGWLGWWFGRALSSEQNVLSFLLICLRKQSKRNCRQKVPTKMRSSKWIQMIQ